ncbi:MAG: NUMOD4 domain-containing protein [Cyanobacteria bacterium P01_G01_bin.49]
MDNITEIWKDIPGYEGLYQVSNQGRVKSVARVIKSKTGQTYWYSGKILTSGKTNKGYLKVDLKINGKTNSKNIHRLVAMVFVANKNNKPQVNHIDGDKLNNNSSNLEWVTNLENRRHALKNNLQYTKIDSPDCLIAIKVLKDRGLTLEEIGAIFGVTKTTISRVLKGKSLKRFDY